MLGSGREITEVFTPRQSEMNPDMYIARPDVEKLLLRSAKRNSHAIICGESGIGKSWLYKKVLMTAKIPYKIANCANASRKNSLTSEIVDALVESGTVVKTSYSEEKNAKLKIPVAEAGVGHDGQFEIKQNDPLLYAFEQFGRGKRGRKILVLDNLESIFSSKDLMDELADIIILLDDVRYAKYGINLLIVGVPEGVLEYFSRTKNMTSVANRLEELPKIKGLQKNQVEDLVRKGFQLLKMRSIPQSYYSRIASHIYMVTLGIPQRVHEYCERLAYEMEDNSWAFRIEMLDRTDQTWLLSSLRQSYGVVEGHLNSRETKVARRNQVIYIVGKTSRLKFDANYIDLQIRKEFPQTIPKTNMGISYILNELSSGARPLLKRLDSNNEYCVSDPIYVMGIRVMLYKEAGSGVIQKKDFSR